MDDDCSDDEIHGGKLRKLPLPGVKLFKLLYEFAGTHTSHPWTVEKYRKRDCITGQIPCGDVESLINAIETYQGCCYVHERGAKRPDSVSGSASGGECHCFEIEGASYIQARSLPPQLL